ncbi:hypothetical protein N7528_004342 [Penicillium herquei]|nr:hypothetical protein N7528_004342 [Penicillium herquei]
MTKERAKMLIQRPHAKHSDPKIWLGLVMPDKRTMDTAVVYNYEKFPADQKGMFRFPDNGYDHLFLSMAANGLVELRDASRRNCDYNFPDHLVPRTAGDTAKWDHGYYFHGSHTTAKYRCGLAMTYLHISQIWLSL